MNNALSHLTLSPIHETLFNLCMSLSVNAFGLIRLACIYRNWTKQHNKTQKEKEWKETESGGNKNQKQIHPPNVFYGFENLCIGNCSARWTAIIWGTHIAICYIYTYGIDCGKTQCPFALKFVRRETSAVVVVFTFQ